MSLIQIDKDVYVKPDEVVSVERDYVPSTYNTPSGGHISQKGFDGSRIILKNGRKIFVNGVMPKDILIKLGMNSGT